MSVVAVIREAMRLYPPVAGRLVVPLEDTTVAGGKYALKKDTWMIVQTMSAQRDSKCWGDDVSEHLTLLVFW
jgi:cytochrome P450/NADPH-cytochrome P450 reductase